MTRIAVTGATGQIGHALVAILRQQGHEVRAIGRSAERLAGVAALGAVPAVGSLDDPRFAAAAFRGADAVFAMHPPDYTHPDPDGRADRIIEAIGVGLQVARVRFAVSLSSIGAEQAAGNGPIAILHRLEQRLEQVPALSLVHLRPTWFFENFLMAIGLIHQTGANGGPWDPDVPVPMIATRDIAAVAAGLLTGPPPKETLVRELHGPRDHTLREATAILGAAIGKPDLAYVRVGDEEAKNGLTAIGLSPASASAIVEMIRGFSERRIGPLAPRSAATTTPTGLEEFARTVFAPAFRV